MGAAHTQEYAVFQSKQILVPESGASYYTTFLYQRLPVCAVPFGSLHA